MIKHLKLNYGESTNADALNLDVSAVTIFVGPNNSGKSLVLREIEQMCNNPEPELKIVDQIDFDELDDKELLALLLKKKIERPIQLPHVDGHICVQKINLVSGQVEVLQVHLEALVLANKEKGTNFSYLARNFISLYTVRLDGRTRFALTDSRPAGDLLGKPTNHLMALFQDDAARETIREITKDAFGLYFTIDPTNMKEFRIRLSEREPIDSLEEQSLDQRARDFHSEAHDISLLSDGVKAFTGLVSALHSQDFRVTLIDEPEAFLHPPLARKLGNVLSRSAEKRGSKAFISTHSADFVMGCIQSGQNVNIIRLTYDGFSRSARLLSSDDLSKMMRNPILRSTGLLSALFHENVIVSESDADRAFYQEINERLNLFEDSGSKSCLFLNAQNKQTIGRLISPLRKMGVPAVAVVDLDIIKKSSEFKEICKACNVPQAILDSWGMLRGNVNKLFEDNDLNSNENGINDLPEKHRDSALMLVENLKEYGIFAVPVGALEQWLPELNVQASKHGPAWLMEAFEKMGENPESSNYAKPGKNDVWSFIRGIVGWLTDTNRKGI